MAVFHKDKELRVYDNLERAINKEYELLGFDPSEKDLIQKYDVLQENLIYLFFNEPRKKVRKNDLEKYLGIYEYECPFCLLVYDGLAQCLCFMW